MKTKLFAIIAVVISLIAGYFMATYAYKSSQDKATSGIDQTIFLRDYAPRMGSTNPKVYLVEFFDPECESCRAFYPHVKQILEENKDVQLVLRYAPFHPNSLNVVKILEAARKQNRYFETLEVLYKYQPQWGDHHNPRPDLVWKFLEEVDLNIERVRNEMNDPAVLANIEQDIKDLETLQVRGTPTFFVNGRPLPSFGLEPLKKLIKEELSK
ncbi:MAG: thioredoxin domain-containing protein [Candidatus Caldatribacteriota bacterium]